MIKSDLLMQICMVAANKIKKKIKMQQPTTNYFNCEIIQSKRYRSVNDANLNGQVKTMNAY